MIPNCKKDIIIDADNVHWENETFLNTYLTDMFNSREILTFISPTQVDSSLTSASHYDNIINAMPSNSIVWFTTGDTNSNGFYNESIYNITNYYYCTVIIWKKDITRGMIQIFLCGNGRTDYYSGNIMRFSNGITRASISHIGSEPWITPTLLNGFENYDSAFNPVQYRLENNRVFLKGMLKNGTLNKPLFNIPARYLPKKLEMLVGYCDTSDTNANQLRHLVEVNPSNGSIIPGRYAGSSLTYSWYSLDGLSWSID